MSDHKMKVKIKNLFFRYIFKAYNAIMNLVLITKIYHVLLRIYVSCIVRQPFLGSKPKIS